MSIPISLMRGNYNLDCGAKVNNATITNTDIYMRSDGSGIINMNGAIISNGGTANINAPNPGDLVNVQFLQQYTGTSSSNNTYTVILNGTSIATPFSTVTTTVVSSSATINNGNINVGGNILTIGGTITGTFAVGMILSGTNVLPGTTITSIIDSTHFTVDQTQLVPARQIQGQSSVNNNLIIQSGAVYINMVALNVDTSTGGPSATFTACKTTSGVDGSHSRLSSCGGIGTGERLKMYWYSGNTIQFAKTGINYNGTYQIQVNILGN